MANNHAPDSQTIYNQDKGRNQTIRQPLSQAGSHTDRQPQQADQYATIWDIESHHTAIRQPCNKDIRTTRQPV